MDAQQNIEYRKRVRKAFECLSSEFNADEQEKFDLVAVAFLSTFEEIADTDYDTALRLFASFNHALTSIIQYYCDCDECRGSDDAD